MISIASTGMYAVIVKNIIHDAEWNTLTFAEDNLPGSLTGMYAVIVKNIIYTRRRMKYIDFSINFRTLGHSRKG